jgi:hypothetical protein
VWEHPDAGKDTGTLDALLADSTLDADCAAAV